VSRRVAFATLGCRLNQVDSQVMQAALEARGFATVPFGAPADVVVVNTCTVTARAEVSDRQAIRRARRANPEARVVATGCWAQTSPGEVARVAGVDLVVGNADKDRLPTLLEELLAAPRGVAPRVAVSDLREARIAVADPRARPAGRSRAFVKVQDGCQHRCAFCVVPLARGASRSLDPTIVADQVRVLVEAGHPEVTLTGVDLGHYGADLVPRTTLAALLRDLVEIDGLRWLRLSSMLPAYFTDDVVDVLTGAPVIAPHFHIPLQSGSDRVLRAMRRPYSVAMYRRVVDRLAAIPRLGLGADVIAGFPGETEDDARATEGLIEALPFTYLHVFPYSDRNGTEAAGRPAHVDTRTVNRRAARLRALGAARALAFRRALMGREEDVLVLETRERATGGLVGLTGNYVEVVFDGPGTLMRRLVRVRLTAVDAGGVRGERVA
jgi:threonylcarbamoyladenosine tRNA methylthiotransferase MtaB